MGRKLSRALQAIVLLSVTTVTTPGAIAAEAEQEVWDAVKAGGYTILMRHALAPGTGDPDEFDVTDCATQRNLSDEGREQARQTGQRFRDQGINALVVYSSQWCRCEETARLLDLGEVRTDEGLNSFFADRSQQDGKTQSAMKLIAEHKTQAEQNTLMLVTHQVNITALTDIYPRSGEMVVVNYEDGRLVVVGTIE